jgi:hypothetical protein
MRHILLYFLLSDTCLVDGMMVIVKEKRLLVMEGNE